jgi:S-adenosylmethionine decarboxylase
MKAQMWNKNGWIKEVDPSSVKNKFSELLSMAGFDILNFQEHYFEPQGYTALWLLGESHFAIHTFPEDDKSYIELSSCNEEYFIYFIEQLSHLWVGEKK